MCLIVLALHQQPVVFSALQMRLDNRSDDCAATHPLQMTISPRCVRSSEDYSPCHTALTDSARKWFAAITVGIPPHTLGLPGAMC